MRRCELGCGSCVSDYMCENRRDSGSKVTHMFEVEWILSA